MKITEELEKYRQKFIIYVFITVILLMIPAGIYVIVEPILASQPFGWLVMLVSFGGSYLFITVISILIFRAMLTEVEIRVEKYKKGEIVFETPEIETTKELKGEFPAPAEVTITKKKTSLIG